MAWGLYGHSGQSELWLKNFFLRFICNNLQIRLTFCIKKNKLDLVYVLIDLVTLGKVTCFNLFPICNVAKMPSPRTDKIDDYKGFVPLCAVFSC